MFHDDFATDETKFFGESKSCNLLTLEDRNDESRPNEEITPALGPPHSSTPRRARRSEKLPTLSKGTSIPLVSSA
jgi:hypothetical protein